MNLEHSRHRSSVNFLVHILACVSSYAIGKSSFNLNNLSASLTLLIYRLKNQAKNVLFLSIEFKQTMIFLITATSSTLDALPALISLL